MPSLKQAVAGNELIVAPVALNPIMARLAEDAGFKALYLSGGSLGWLKCVTEANLTLPELAAVALDIGDLRVDAAGHALGHAFVEQYGGVGDVTIVKRGKVFHRAIGVDRRVGPHVSGYT